MVYAAKDVQGGMIVAEPLCREDFWTTATKHVQSPAVAIVKRIYLDHVRTQVVEAVCDLTSHDWTLDYIVPEGTLRPGLTTSQKP
jgi:hypothetical protein